MPRTESDCVRLSRSHVHVPDSWTWPLTELCLVERECRASWNRAAEVVDDAAGRRVVACDAEIGRRARRPRVARGDAEEIEDGRPGKCDYREGGKTVVLKDVWGSLLLSPTPSVMS